jgi:predicted small lipoprotein YifL
MRDSARVSSRTVLLWTCAVLAALALAGCSQKKADNSPSFAKSAIDRATSATQPNAIQLTNQTLTYECPKCGVDYDKAGKCPTDGADLVAMQVSYICPADHQPVDQAGKCPRCQMDATIQKVALNGGGTP